jgi:AcrR family transcriptional regulator
VACLEKQGPAALTLREVARRARVSHTAPYHHFPSRDALLEAVAAGGFDRLREAIVEHVRRQPPTPWAPLQEAGVGYVLFAVDHPHLYRLMFGAALGDRQQSNELTSAAGAAFELIRGGIASAVAGTAVPPEHLEILGRSCWAMVHGVASLAIDGHLGTTDRDELAAQTRAVTDVLWHGLARGGRPSG